MLIDAELLQNKPEPMKTCPKCGQPFESFLRGQTQRSKRSYNPFKLFKKQDYCACICSKCKKIVGWESPWKRRLY